MFLEEIENECDAHDIKMTFPERANEAERRMKEFATFLYSEYLKKG